MNEDFEKLIDEEYALILKTTRHIFNNPKN